jgi:peptidoglycan hydrolase-like protein with peptidoglycan-binding domain
MNRPLLRLGSNGPSVTLLQQALNLGESLLDALDEDGIFGHLTQGRVQEFQDQNELTADGIVGPQTHGALEEFYQLLTQIFAPTPQVEDEARKKIVALARAALLMVGWPDDSPGPPGPGSLAIAGRFGVGPPLDARGTQLRQGGQALSTIFQFAGHPNAPQAQVITQAARTMYATNSEPPAKVRNSTDIPSWCGVFALYVYRALGLKVSPWPLRVGTPAQAAAEFRSVPPAQVKPGDIGVYDPVDGGHNHHFLVVEKNGSTLKTIDGNAGVYQSIVSRTYTVAGGMTNGFFNLQTDRGMKQAAFFQALWGKIL